MRNLQKIIPIVRFVQTERTTQILYDLLKKKTINPALCIDNATHYTHKYAYGNCIEILLKNILHRMYTAWKRENFH